MGGMNEYGGATGGSGPGTGGRFGGGGGSGCTGVSTGNSGDAAHGCGGGGASSAAGSFAPGVHAVPVPVLEALASEWEDRPDRTVDGYRSVTWTEAARMLREAIAHGGRGMSGGDWLRGQALQMLEDITASLNIAAGRCDQGRAGDQDGIPGVVTCLRQWAAAVEALSPGDELDPPRPQEP